MNSALFIARRYFFSKKNTHAVNLITGVSMLGVAIGAAAMLVVLSAFNGLENLIQSLYNNFDPDVKISATLSKRFEVDAEQLQALRAFSFVEAAAVELEERAMVRYREKDFIATIKGVDNRYDAVSNVRNMLLRGQYFSGSQTAVFGAGVAYHLSLGDLATADGVQIFTAQAGKVNLRRPEEAFKQTTVLPVGIFAVQPEYDVKYILMPITTLQVLLDANNRATAIAVKLKPGVNERQAIAAITDLFGADFRVQNRAAQQELLFKVMRTEGLATYLILAFLLLIASFSLFGSLTMLIIDKQKDLRTLWSIGADVALLKRVFFYNGLFVTVLGCALGLLLGAGVVALQHHYELVTLGQGYVVEAYPVAIRGLDLLKIALTVLGIGVGLSFWSSARLRVQPVVR
jgi:lipoprotein-releasing system permease protein